MSNTFTLDAVRESVIRKFAPVKVGLSDGSSVELKSILKLNEKAREQALAAIEEIKNIEDPEDDNDDELVAEYSEKVCESVAKIFRLIANSPRKLLAELDDEDPQIKATLHTEVLKLWIGESQLGEAASSPS